jgi:hypothetical protein
VACMRGQEMHTRFWWRYLKEISDLEGLDIDESIILKWMKGVVCGRAWTGLIWLDIWTHLWLL